MVLTGYPSILYKKPMISPSTTFADGRRKTREVAVGSVKIGSNYPIRIQSMTHSKTADIHATTDQIMKLADMGCEIVRVTVQGKKEAYACEEIKNTLLSKGYTIPIAADIHFFPPAAFIVADYVDKVRINPGNFVKCANLNTSPLYSKEQQLIDNTKIIETFIPLIEKCKKNGVAIRIGTNHGSLSQRVMYLYGDTPQGMVFSAIEFGKICVAQDFHNFLFSMKSSNTQIMIQAYQMLVSKMNDLCWDYPLHLGVTEAGEGEDGRVKSAIGIGSLLLDGIGDTIRVSLTEDPWFEIDPCRQLVKIANTYQKQIPHNIHYLTKKKEIKRANDKYKLFESEYFVVANHNFSTDTSADAFFDGKMLKSDVYIESIIPIRSYTGKGGVYIKDGDIRYWQLLLNTPPKVIFFELSDFSSYNALIFEKWLRDHHLSNIIVVLVWKYYGDSQNIIISASTELGYLFSKGFGTGIMLKTNLDLKSELQLAFSILQGCRLRSTKTEYIACPSCGRTLFNLQEVTQKIKEKTDHLPGVKIAVMGCIVNGIGEMADADFGYVGAGKEKIDLFVGRKCVQRGIHYSKAVDSLINLIKEQGMWID